MNDVSEPERRRFGVISADPLRFLGLQTIFPEESGVEIVPVERVSSPIVGTLSLVMIDASCTALVFELLAAFEAADPTLRVVVMGLERSLSYQERVIGSGAKGYLTHNATETEIRMAVDIVLDGSIWAPRKVLARLLERGTETQKRLIERPALTPREKDVLRRLITGASNKQIGVELAIDAAAVKAHVGRLMRKVGVTNRTALSVESTRRRLLE